jgi:hypothetical protein
MKGMKEEEGYKRPGRTPALIIRKVEDTLLTKDSYRSGSGSGLAARMGSLEGMMAVRTSSKRHISAMYLLNNVLYNVLYSVLYNVLYKS